MKKLINTIIIISYMFLCVFLLLLFKDVLNKKELLLIISFLLILEFIFIYLLKKNVLLFFSYPCIIVLLVFLFAIGLKTNTVFKFVNEVVTKNNVIDNYRVLVLKDKYKKLEELSNKKIGYTKDTIGFNHLKIKFTSICYDDFDEMLSDLDNNKLDAIIILNERIEYLNDEKYEIIYKLEFNEEIVAASKNILSDTSLIYVSGINNTKSDVNLILGINNNTKQVLLISIPKDYYVLLPSKEDYDRMGYASIYGITEAIKTVENLLKNYIDYYIKIDLNKVGPLINALNGIEVDSEYDFISSSIHFKKGINKLNGEEAIVFASEIKGSTLENKYANNSEKVVEAILKKIIENNNYLNVLEELKKTIKTNISEENILKLIKEKFAYNYNFNTIKYSLSGVGDFKYTYSYKCCKLNVIEPDTISVNEAITLIEYLKEDGVFN